MSEIRQVVRVNGPTRLLVVTDGSATVQEVHQMAQVLRERFPDVEFTFLNGGSVHDLGPAPDSEEITR